MHAPHPVRPCVWSAVDSQHHPTRNTQQARDMEAETVVVGDEHGVQGRFQQSVGQVLGKVPDAQAIDQNFADFKCIGSPYQKTPDVVTMSRGNVLKVRTREAVWQSLPPLLQGPHRTKSSALHDLGLVARLRERPNFLQDVIVTDLR